MSLRVRLVLVEPEGKINFGHVLRLSRNFGIDDICVVNPKFDIRDREVVEFAAGGAGLVDRVRLASDLAECLAGTDFSVCTTAIAGAPDDPLRQAVSPRAIPLLIPRGSRVALVFGRESVGLTRSELARCSLISTLETPSDYNVLNLSHAVAIYLYELLAREHGDLVVGERCPGDYVGLLARYLEKLGAAYGLEEHEVAALKHVVNKALLTRVECRVLYRFLKASLATYRTLHREGPQELGDQGGEAPAPDVARQGAES